MSVEANFILAEAADEEDRLYGLGWDVCGVAEERQGFRIWISAVGRGSDPFCRPTPQRSDEGCWFGPAGGDRGLVGKRCLPGAHLPDNWLTLGQRFAAIGGVHGGGQQLVRIPQIGVLRAQQFWRGGEADLVRGLADSAFGVERGAERPTEPRILVCQAAGREMLRHGSGLLTEQGCRE